MSGLRWADSLDAPRSLATRDNTAVAVIEDPGVIEIRLPLDHDPLRRRCGEIVGLDLPDEPWRTVTSNDIRAVWLRPWRWQILLPRERVATLMAEFGERVNPPVVADLTGAFACFKIVGETSGDILARVTPLNLDSVPPDRACGTSIGGVRCLLVREQRSSWMALSPRSYARYVGSLLIEAARTPGRLALFEPASAPPV